jgi:hypothetical protein
MYSASPAVRAIIDLFASLMWRCDVPYAAPLDERRSTKPMPDAPPSTIGATTMFSTSAVRTDPSSARRAEGADLGLQLQQATAVSPTSPVRQPV